MSREYTPQNANRRGRGRRPPPLLNCGDPARVLSAATSRSRLGRNEAFEVWPNIPASFRLQHIASPNNLRVAWNLLAEKGGRAAGVDGISLDVSSSDVWTIVRHLAHDIQAGTYYPGQTREIRIPRPGKADRVIEIPNMRDRVVGKAIASALKPVLRSELTRFYGIGRENIFAQMKVEAETNNRFYIVTDDILNCYPTANRETVMNAVRQSSTGWCRVPIPWEEFGLIDLIHRIAYGHQGEGQPTGLTQGGTLSPLLMELTLHATVDAAFHAGSSTRTILFRYVDDLCVQAQNPSDALEAMEVIRNTVNQNGQSLKSVSAEPVDLRDNSPDITILGLLPTRDNGQLTFSMTDSTWQHLRDLLEECQLLAVPHKAAKESITGWINSIGPCIRASDREAVMRQITGILTQCNIEPGRGFNLEEVINKAAERWQELITQTQTRLCGNNTHNTPSQARLPQWGSFYGTSEGNSRDDGENDCDSIGDDCDVLPDFANAGCHETAPAAVF